MFRSVTASSCIICRINYPWSNNGLAIAKRLVASGLGAIAICRDHYQRKDAYCGLCLREGPPMEIDAEFGMVCVYQNDDDQTWPDITSTCRSCRVEALWSRVADRPADREAVGGPKWRSADWEVRQSVESFLDLGEGTVNDVITLAREKYWLRRHTKLADMLQQALASARYVARTEAGETGYGSDEEMSDEDDEEDVEVMSATEDQGGVKDFAIMDWARNRILDGFWISPADQWYNNITPGQNWHAPAQHPCPWNRDALYSGAVEDGESESGNGEELEHPRPKTVKADVPPSFQLCDQTFRCFQRSLRDVLLPAMSNLVRRIVIECAADGSDPTLRASRMSMEDVIQELRDEAVWFNGIDWLERKANRAKEERDRLRSQGPRSAEEDDSSSSSRSDGSHTTSPVLSTTTLQTTPSPPPSGDPSSSPKEEDLVASSPTTAANLQLSIPISPVLKSPQLIHPIPYIPVAIGHLPCYSMDALKLVWREACAPLYHCRCSICERAILKANIAAGTVVPSQTTTAVEKPAPPAAQHPPENKPIMIHFKNPGVRPQATTAEEEEEDEDDSLLDSDDSFADDDGSDDLVQYVATQRRIENDSLQPGTIVYPVTPRKRPSQELDPDDEWSHEAKANLESFKNYKPDVEIVYYDEFGRVLTPKEAWKVLSHKFHGKGSGKMKTEKRLKKIAEDRKKEAMASGDTPLSMNQAFQIRQEKGPTQSGYSTVTPSTAHQLSTSWDAAAANERTALIDSAIHKLKPSKSYTTKDIFQTISVAPCENLNDSIRKKRKVSDKNVHAAAGSMNVTNCKHPISKDSIEIIE
ncbi:hypothetical protein EUX98_g8123 [Antrodiella citrinella]|uniref:Uncharacterized protein n=1 Tax=Antrodiella citrinella TaxID=2447956 RepID=A0A4S4MC43_9APHY|nr:hypothetical protein EUX98_g8123 [Antrodiella citrinella]